MPDVKKQSETLRKIGKAIWKKIWGTGKGFKDIDAAAKSQKKKLKIMKEIDR